MSAVSISGNVTEIGGAIGGDISVGRGQLGLTAVDTLTSDITLWTEYPERPSKYIFTNTSGATRIVTLPPVGTLNNEAQIGNDVMIINSSASTNNIQVNNSSAVTILTIPPDNSAEIVSSNEALTWTTFIDSNSIGSTDLQGAYDNGNSINLASNNPVDINNVGDANTDILNISGSSDYLNVKNITATSYEPAIEIFGATANNSQSLVLGQNNSSSHDNTVIMGDSSFTHSSLAANRFQIGFTGGFQQLGGPILPGTINTDPNVLRVQGKVRTSNTTFTTILTVSTTTDTAYNLQSLVLGATDGASGSDEGNVTARILGNCSNDGGSADVEGQNRQILRGANVGSAQVRYLASGSDILLQVRGNAGTNMTWIAYLDIMEYKWN